jgi:hypothetical protein
MKTVFKLYGKTISKKKAIEIYGKETIDYRIKDAKETFFEDPYTQISWADGLSIEFV